MAYSNITPPTLPEYDSALYSHYVLEFEYENGLDNWFAVSLRYSSTPFTYDGTAVTNAGEHHLQTYGTGTGEWTYWGTLTEMSIAPGTTSTGGYRRIWTNHNILDGPGNVWLAANTATPAEANLDRLSIMKSKLAGLIMAWCAPVRQFPQREPVAFLYNGVRLPELPEWDKTAYPYALIVDGLSIGLIVSPTKAYFNQTTNDVAGVDFEAGTVYLQYNLINGVWKYYTDNPRTYRGSPSDGFGTYDIWANYDILYEDGTVYRTASEPVPVYE